MASHATLLQRYKEKHGKLIEPRQGWGSLHDSLHLAYSMGRVRGFTDLGTYVDKPLDHGWDDVRNMARAFDLGRKDPKFWRRQYGQLMAWRYCRLLVKNYKALGIDYVIYRDKIWSRKNMREDLNGKILGRVLVKPWWLGWHYYGPDTSHFWHIHVSGSIGKAL